MNNFPSTPSIRPEDRQAVPEFEAPAISTRAGFSRTLRVALTVLVAVLAAAVSPTLALASGGSCGAANSGSTCVQVNGGGLTVNSIQGHVSFGNHAYSGHWDLRLGGQDNNISAYVSGTGYIWFYPNSNIKFHNQEKVCLAFWVYNQIGKYWWNSGNPCVTIVG